MVSMSFLIHKMEIKKVTLLLSSGKNIMGTIKKQDWQTAAIFIPRYARNDKHSLGLQTDFFSPWYTNNYFFCIFGRLSAILE